MEKKIKKKNKFKKNEMPLGKVIDLLDSSEKKRIK